MPVYCLYSVIQLSKYTLYTRLVYGGKTFHITCIQQCQQTSCQLNYAAELPLSDRINTSDEYRLFPYCMGGCGTIFKSIKATILYNLFNINCTTVITIKFKFDLVAAPKYIFEQEYINGNTLGLFGLPYLILILQETNSTETNSYLFEFD